MENILIPGMKKVQMLWSYDLKKKKRKTKEKKKKKIKVKASVNDTVQSEILDSEKHHMQIFQATGNWEKIHHLYKRGFTFMLYKGKENSPNRNMGRGHEENNL